MQQAPASLASWRQNDADASAFVPYHATRYKQKSNSYVRPDRNISDLARPSFHLSWRVIQDALICESPCVLSSHEEATFRCAKARPGSNSSAGSKSTSKAEDLWTTRA